MNLPGDEDCIFGVLMFNELRSRVEGYGMVLLKGSVMHGVPMVIMYIYNVFQLSSSEPMIFYP